MPSFVHDDGGRKCLSISAKSFLEHRENVGPLNTVHYQERRTCLHCFDLLVLTRKNEAHRARKLVTTDRPDEQPESNSLSVQMQLIPSPAVSFSMQHNEGKVNLSQ